MRLLLRYAVGWIPRPGYPGINFSMGVSCRPSGTWSPFPRTKEDIIYTRHTQPDLRKRVGNLDTARAKPSNCFFIKPYPLLVFFTVSVVLRIRGQLPRIITDLLPLENHTVSLRDKTNTFCGLLTFDVPSSPEPMHGTYNFV